MKLSVIVLFSDGDKKCFSHWVESAKTKIKVEHELIAVDNTSDGSLPETEGVKIVRGSRDAGCFVGRKIGFKASCGEYIWYCDGDDEILTLAEFPFTADMVCFNYMAQRKGEDMGIGKDPYLVSFKAEADSFYHALWKKQCKNMVWNKFFKRHVLYEIYNAMPEFEMYTSEDALLSLLAEMVVHSIEFSHHAYYLYYLNNGMSENTIRDIEKFKRIFRGTKEGWAYYKYITTAEQRELAGIRDEDLMINLCKYALDQNERADAVFKEYVHFLCEYFSEHLVLGTLEAFKSDYRKNYYRIKQLVNDFKK